MNPDKRDTGISAFLPSQQLWNWFGPPAKTPKKGRGRIIHTGIARKKERLFTGDCAVFLSTGRPDRPFIGRLDSMWETSTGNKRVRVKWFYHAAETEGLANQGKRVQDLTLPVSDQFKVHSLHGAFLNKRLSLNLIYRVPCLNPCIMMRTICKRYHTDVRCWKLASSGKEHFRIEASWTSFMKTMICITSPVSMTLLKGPSSLPMEYLTKGESLSRKQKYLV